MIAFFLLAVMALLAMIAGPFLVLYLGHGPAWATLVFLGALALFLVFADLDRRHGP